MLPSAFVSIEIFIGRCFWKTLRPYNTHLLKWSQTSRTPQGRYSSFSRPDLPIEAKHTTCLYLKSLLYNTFVYFFPGTPTTYMNLIWFAMSLDVSWKHITIQYARFCLNYLNNELENLWSFGVYNCSKVPWNDLFASPVGHPFVLLFILENPDDDGVGNGPAQVWSRHSVQALILWREM